MSKAFRSPMLASFLISILSAQLSHSEPLELTMMTKGTFGNSQKFESLGKAFIPSAVTELKNVEGGYTKLYAEFKSESPNVGTDPNAIWQDAIRFQNYLAQNYSVNIDTEVLASQMAMDSLLSSTKDTQLKPLLNELGRNLTFEQKIAFGAQLGGVFLRGYDNSRANSGENSKGIVTLREMIEARQLGKKAGVCRDISVGVAKVVEDLGGVKAFVTAYRTNGGGHATVIAIDPENPGKSYNINYDYVTSENSINPLNHLRQDSTIPDTGISVRIYDADGKALSQLPNNLGTALTELTGGDVTNLDPMLRSENDVANAFIQKGSIQLGSGIATTADGTTVAGFTAAYVEGSPSQNQSRIAIALYKSEQKTNLYGPLNQVGGFLSADQKIYSKPLTIDTGGGGKLQMRIKGQINLNLQFSKIDYRDSQSTGMDQNTSFGVGGEANYRKGDTNVNASVMASGGLEKSDVRNEQSMAPYLRDITSIIQISQQINKSIEAFMKTQLTVRSSELGAQVRSEIGARLKIGKNTDISMLAGVEGQAWGQELPFIPGSQRMIYLEGGANWKKKLGIAGGVRCLSQDLKNCSYYSGGKLSLKLKAGEIEKALGIN